MSEVQILSPRPLFSAPRREQDRAVTRRLDAGRGLGHTIELCVNALRRSTLTPAPAEGGAGSKRTVLGCDPGAGCSAAIARVLTCAFTVASPKSGASRGGRGTLWDLTPGDAHGSAFETTRHDRLHGRIPQAGPCSTFRRSLLNVSAHPLPEGEGQCTVRKWDVNHFRIDQ